MSDKAVCETAPATPGLLIRWDNGTSGMTIYNFVKMALLCIYICTYLIYETLQPALLSVTNLFEDFFLFWQLLVLCFKIYSY